MFYALVKDQPKIISKVNLFIALAPIARLAHPTSSGIKAFANNLSFIEIGTEWSHLWRLFTDKQKKYVDFDGIVKAVSGGDETKSHSDPDAAKVGHKYFPQPTSVKSLYHLGQIIEHKQFEEYDYRYTDNQKHYGSHNAPKLDLTKITQMPTALFVGVDDSLATVTDVSWLKTQLGNVAHYEVV